MVPARHLPLASNAEGAELCADGDGHGELLVGPRAPAAPPHGRGAPHAHRWGVVPAAAAVMLVFVFGFTTILATRHVSHSASALQSLRQPSKVNAKGFVTLDETVQDKSRKRKQMIESSVAAAMMSTSPVASTTPAAVATYASPPATTSAAPTMSASLQGSTAADTPPATTAAASAGSTAAETPPATTAAASAALKGSTAAETPPATTAAASASVAPPSSAATTSDSSFIDPRVLEICEADPPADMEACTLVISLRDNVSVTGLHEFAEKYNGTKQVHVLEEQKQVVIDYTASEVRECCQAYRELAPAPVVHHVDMVQAYQ